jgi:hypothetical protein
MKRLIAPVGRSRLNLLAALDRVKPQKLIAITTEENHSLTATGIKTASGLDNLEVEIRTLSKAFDIELVRDEMMDISRSFPVTETDYVLISGSTNQICYMCFMHWPGVTVSIKRGLISSIDEVDVQHSITEYEFLSIYDLAVVDRELYLNNGLKQKVFPESVGFEVDSTNGNIKILWQIEVDDDHHKKSNYIRDLVAKSAENLGRKTFHHHVKCVQAFSLHEEIKDLVTFELGGEEE